MARLVKGGGQRRRPWGGTPRRARSDGRGLPSVGGAARAGTALSRTARSHRSDWSSFATSIHTRSLYSCNEVSRFAEALWGLVYAKTPLAKRVLC